MPQNILTAGNATSSQSLAAGDDGTFKIVVGPNGSQVDGLAIGATGNAAVAGTLTQAGVATPRMVLATAQNTTSGTSITFSSIPSWVKKITLMFNGVSTTGTSQKLVRVGSGSVATSGYSGGSSFITAGSVGTLNYSDGFNLYNLVTAADALNGHVILTNVSGNIWACSGVVGSSTTTVNVLTTGVITLGGALDRVVLTTTGGTDTFDAGSVNILYEG